MDNPFDEMRRAVQAARELNRAVDDQANTLADLLDGRLQHVSSYRLKKLKAQLREFNAHTGQWKGDE
jgi:hypothetical protein